MDLLIILGWIGLAILVAGAAWASVAMLLLVAAFRLAASQEEIPRSEACSHGRHAACPGCSCTHHN